MIFKTDSRLSGRILLNNVLLPFFSVFILFIMLLVVPAGVEPIFLTINLGLIFVWFLKWKNYGIFPIEIGSFYFGVVFLYCTMPILVFVFNGFEYHEISDGRLFKANPSPKEVAQIGYYYVFYLAVFAVSYIIFRKQGGNLVHNKYLQPSMFIVRFLFIFYLLIELPIFYLKYSALGGISTYDYTQQYLWMDQYPLVVRQILNHVSGMGFILQIFIITYLFLVYRKTRFFIAAFLLFKFSVLIFNFGARTEFAVLAAASIICYYNYVKTFSAVRMLRFVKKSPLWKVIAISIVFISLFLLFGLARNFQSDGSISSNVIFPSTEFESQFATAYDINSRKLTKSIGSVQNFYFFEGIINLVPQQFLPFEKPSLSRWYVDTFFQLYAQAGGGFAFGVVPEALLSNSVWLSLTWRAVFHGILLAWIFNIFHRNTLKGPIKVAAYISITVLSYQLLRDTTFSLIPKIVFDLLPVVIIVYLVSTSTHTKRYQSVSAK